MPITGKCYCGDIRYQAEGDPIFKLQCHCRECQYSSGGGANYTLVMPEDGFSYTLGSPQQFSRTDIEKPVTREFCAKCGTHLVSRPNTSGMALIKVGTLDDPSVFDEADMAIYTEDKQGFHHIPEGMTACERTPG